MDFFIKLLKFLLLSIPLSAAFYFFINKYYRYLLAAIVPENKNCIVAGRGMAKYEFLIVLGVYTSLTVLYFFQYFSNLSLALIGPPGDNMQSFWNFWWGYNVISGKMGEFASTNFLFYPEGTSLIYHSFSWYNLFLSFILRQAFDPVFVYNILILHTYILAGLGAFLLARYLLGNTWMALLAGFIFSFSPAHSAHLQAHINISSIQFIPFFVLYFIKAIKEGGWKHLLLSALFLFLNTACSWNYLIFASYFMVFSYFYLAIRNRRLILGPFICRAAGITLLGLIPFFPWILQMIFAGIKYPAAAAVGHNYYVADLLGFFVPNSHHLLNNVPPMPTLNRLFTGNLEESTVYLGIPVMAAIIAAYKSLIKSGTKYLMALSIFMILSMGSTLHILGYSSPILLPYRIIFHLPFLSMIRCPSRHIFYAYLFLGILAALAVKYLYTSERFARHGKYTLMVFLVLLILDYYPGDKTMTPVYLPQCYEIISEDSGYFAILDIPEGYVESNTYMMYQTMHNNPIVGGAISRKLWKTLIDSLELSDLQVQRLQLCADSVKYVIIHKDFMHPQRLIDTANYEATYSKIYSDKSNMVFRVY